MSSTDPHPTKNREAKPTIDHQRPMEVIGPEREKDRELREWFDDQEKGNLDRLEEGAKTIIQLVTGLYGVLFAVLALSNQPDYLQEQTIQIVGTASLVAFFVALICAVLVVLPRPHRYHQDSLTAMRHTYNDMLKYKSRLLLGTMVLFLIGTACLGAVILVILWSM